MTADNLSALTSPQRVVEKYKSVAKKHRPTCIETLTYAWVIYNPHGY